MLNGASTQLTIDRFFALLLLLFYCICAAAAVDPAKVPEIGLRAILLLVVGNANGVP